MRDSWGSVHQYVLLTEKRDKEGGVGVTASRFNPPLSLNRKRPR